MRAGLTWFGTWGLRIIVVGLLVFLATQGNNPGGNIALLGAAVLYLLPTLVAGMRKKVHPGGVVVVNLLLGWTFVGWIIALAWAFSGETKTDRLTVRPA